MLFRIFRYIIILALLCSPITAYSAVNQVEEADGSPTMFPWKVKVPNGSMTNNGDGTASLSWLTSFTESDPLSLHKDGSSTASASIPFIQGLSAGSTNQLSIDASGNVLTSGTLGAGAITGTSLTDGIFSVTGGAVTGATGNISMWTNDSGYLTSYSETDPIYSANAYAVGMNQGVATSDSPIFAGITSDLATLGYEAPTYDFTTSLTGYWKCNDASWAGGGFVVIDSSGNGHDGIATGAVTETNSRNNIYNGYLDGSNDDVTITDHADFDATTAVTISAWIYRTADSGTTEWIVSKWRTAGNQGSYYLRMSAIDEVMFGVSQTGAGSTAIAYSNTKIALNNWYHLTGVYDGSAVKIYINGVLEDSVAYSSGIYSSTANVLFGSYHEKAAYNYQGRIEEVRIYKNRALTRAEVAQLASDNRFTGNANFEKSVGITGGLSVGRGIDLSAVPTAATNDYETLIKFNNNVCGATEAGYASGEGIINGFAITSAGNPLFNIVSGAGNTIFGGGVNGGAYRTFALTTAPSILFGGGTAATDTFLLRVDAGRFGMSGLVITNADANYGTISATKKVLLVRAHASQSVPIVEVDDSAGTTDYFIIASDGEIQIPQDWTTGAKGQFSLGAAQDAMIGFTGSQLQIQSDLVTATDSLLLRGGTNGILFNIGANQRASLSDTMFTAVSITDSALTSGRIPYASTGGLLVDDEDLTFTTGTNALRVGASAGKIGINVAPSYPLDVIGTNLARGANIVYTSDFTGGDTYGMFLTATAAVADSSGGSSRTSYGLRVAPIQTLTLSGGFGLNSPLTFYALFFLATQNSVIGGNNRVTSNNYGISGTTSDSTSITQTTAYANVINDYGILGGTINNQVLNKAGATLAHTAYGLRISNTLNMKDTAGTTTSNSYGGYFLSSEGASASATNVNTYGVYVKGTSARAGTPLISNGVWIDALAGAITRGLVLATDGTSGTAYFGVAQDAMMGFTGTQLQIQSDVVTATDSLLLRGGTNGVLFNVGATQYLALTANTLTCAANTNILLSGTGYVDAVSYKAGGTASVANATYSVYNDGVTSGQVTSITTKGGIITAIAVIP